MRLSSKTKRCTVNQLSVLRDSCGVKSRTCGFKHYILGRAAAHTNSEKLQQYRKICISEAEPNPIVERGF